MSGRKAILLCAGLGTRLGELTKTSPKPLLPLDGKPLLGYNLAYLRANGFTDIAINLHYCSDQIRDAFGDGSTLGVKIHYTLEPELLGTAGAVKNLEGWLADAERFVVMYGDLLTDQPLEPLVEQHQKHDALACLLLHQRKGSNSLVQMESDGRIVGFVERPNEEQRRKHPFPWVFSGIQVLHRRILEQIPPGRSFDLPKDIYSQVAGTEMLRGVPLNAYRCAIDSPDRYAEAEDAVRTGRYVQSSDHG